MLNWQICRYMGGAYQEEGSECAGTDCATGTSSISEDGDLPISLGISPNPFRSECRIGFVVAEDGPVTVEIFDLSGRILRSLPLGHLAAGTQRAVWDGRDDRGALVAAGLYAVRVLTPSGHQSMRVTVLR
jgi:hypothetical protein